MSTLKIKNEKCPFTGILKKTTNVKENDLELLLSYSKEFGYEIQIYDHTERDSVLMMHNVEPKRLKGRVDRNLMTKKHTDFLEKHGDLLQNAYDKLKF